MAEIVASPVLSVVAVIHPRKVSPWSEPLGLLKSSTVKVVLAVPASVSDDGELVVGTDG